MASLARLLLLIYLHRNDASSSSHGLLVPRHSEAYDPELKDLDVHGSIRSGFVSIGVMAILSVVATFTLILFLTYRFLFWKSYYRNPVSHNQYIILIYNLLLADLQQGLGFALCLYWVSREKATYNSAACIMQGWWVQISDPGSGLFILAIAIHTWAGVMRGRQLPYWLFVSCIIGLWTFIIVLGIIPVGLYHRRAFIVSEAGWCWMGREYESARLWCHYIWIFIAEFGTVTLYTVMFFFLRRKMANAKAVRRNNATSLKRLNRVVIYMLIYPLVYLVLSLPLAAGRMASEGKTFPSLNYFAVAGSLMAFSGFMDVLVYTLTRKHLLLETDLSVTDPHSAHNPNVEANDDPYQTGTRISITAGKGINANTTTTETDGKKGLAIASRIRHGFSRYPRENSSSTEDFVRIRDTELADFHGYGVYQETTIEVTHEPCESVSVESTDPVLPKDGKGRFR